MPATRPDIVTPLAGTTTIDASMSFEPERLCYECAQQIAERIANKVSDVFSGKTVVIAGTRLLADFANLRAIYIQLDSLEHDYEALGSRFQSREAPKTQHRIAFESAVAGGVSAVTGVAAAALSPAASLAAASLGLISLFRQDVEYHGTKSTVDALAFEIALAARIKEDGARRAYVPDLVALPPPDTDTGLAARLEQALRAKAAVWASAGPVISELVRLESQLDEAAKSKDQAGLDRLSKEVSDLRRDLAPIIDPLGRLDQRLSDLQNQLIQTDAASGLSQMARLLRAEALQMLEPLYLHATIVSTGGHYRITRNLFRTLFVGDGLSFAGGTTARWALLGNDGSVSLGGIEALTLTGKFGHSGQFEMPPRQSSVENCPEHQPAMNET